MTGKHRLDNGHHLVEATLPLAQALIRLRESGDRPTPHHKHRIGPDGLVRNCRRCKEGLAMLIILHTPEFTHEDTVHYTTARPSHGVARSAQPVLSRWTATIVGASCRRLPTWPSMANPCRTPPMSDPFVGDEWDALADRALDELVPMVRDSFCTVSLVPSGPADVKFALELGFSVMFDKPIVAIVEAGAQVPAKLVAIADEIVEGSPLDPDFAERFKAAMTRMRMKAHEKESDK